jgi:hypothetical protein
MACADTKSNMTEPHSLLAGNSINSGRFVKKTLRNTRVSQSFAERFPKNRAGNSLDANREIQIDNREWRAR